MIRILVSIGVIQVLIMLVALVRAKALAVFLGTAGFGVMSTIDQVVVAAVQVGGVGLPFTAMRLMAHAHSRGHRAFEEVFQTFLRGLFGLGLGVTAICVALGWGDVFGSTLAPYHGALFVGLLSLTPVIVNVLFANTLAAAQLPAASAWLSLILAVALAVAAIGGVLTAGLFGLYTAVTVTAIATSIASLFYLRRRLGLHPGVRSASLFQALTEAPDIVSNSLLVWAGVAAGSVAQLAARYIVLGSLGEAHTGLLQAQFSLGLTVSAVVAPMNALYLAPLVNREMALTHKASAAEEFAKKILLLLLLAGLPICLFPRLALTVLFTAEFAPAAQTLALFVLWPGIFQLASVYLQLLVGLNDARYFAIVVCGGYAAAIALFLPLVGNFGIAGVGAALVIGMLVAVAGAALRLRLRFSYRVSGAVWWRAIYVAAALGAAAALFAPDTEFTAGGSAQRGLFAVAVLAAFWTVLTSDERGLIKRVLLRRQS